MSRQKRKRSTEGDEPARKRPKTSTTEQKKGSMTPWLRRDPERPRTLEDAEFGVKEEVLCFYGPMLYHAKIEDMKLEPEDDDNTGPPVVLYYVHYIGWRKTHDCYVAERRVFKLNEENLERRAHLERVALKAVPVRKPTNRKKKKMQPEVPVVPEEDTLDPAVKVTIPGALKTRLTDDWDFITRFKQLVPLPREHATVEDVLERFKEHTKKQDDALEDLIVGLRTYFNKALSSLLLYPFEELQHTRFKRDHPDKKPSEFYGVEHLLRLFVKLPELLAHTDLEATEMSVLQQRLSDFLSFVGRKDQRDLFAEEYVVPATDYLADPEDAQDEAEGARADSATGAEGPMAPAPADSPPADSTNSEAPPADSEAPPADSEAPPADSTNSEAPPADTPPADSTNSEAPPPADSTNATDSTNSEAPATDSEPTPANSAPADSKA